MAEIDFLNCSFIDAMFVASAVCPHKTKQKHKQVPELNTHCKELYKISGDKFLHWHISGKI